jgi:hypothetical protein
MEEVELLTLPKSNVKETYEKVKNDEVMDLIKECL